MCKQFTKSDNPSFSIELLEHDRMLNIKLHDFAQTYVKLHWFDLEKKLQYK